MIYNNDINKFKNQMDYQYANQNQDHNVIFNELQNMNSLYNKYNNANNMNNNPNMNPNMNPNLNQYQNNFNYNYNNYQVNQVNQNLNDVYVNDNNLKNQGNNNQNNNEENLMGLTPTGDENEEEKNKKELENYYKGLDEEKIKDQKVIEYYKRKSSHYLSYTISFSYSDFKKAPTTYIENESINLTYMSCVIQCLANIKPIAKFYLKEKKNFAKYMDKFALNYAFSRIISNIYSYPEEKEQQFYNTFKIDEFKKLVVEINKFFQGNSTKHANKFLHFLLEELKLEQEQTLNKDNNPFKNNINDFKIYYKELLEQNNSLFFNCFNWIQKKKKICENEQHEIVEYNNYLTYELDIKNYIDKYETNINNQKNQIKTIEINILDCIKNDYREEKLYNINCSKCEKKTPMHQYTSIVISPNYFIFLTGLRDHPKNIYEKFNKNNFNQTEIFTFKIQEEIDLSDIIENKNSHTKYRLDGLISFNFLETNKYKIYYTAYYRSPIDNNWYQYQYAQKQFQKIDISNVMDSFEKYNLLPSILIYSHK